MLMIKQFVHLKLSTLVNYNITWRNLSEIVKCPVFINVIVVLGWSEQLPDTLVDESVSVSESSDKIKKRYRKRKNKLEETFPVYLQVIFFNIMFTLLI